MQFRVPSVLALLLGVSAEQQPTRSFKFPFDTLDSAGKRTVPEWSVGGDAAINKGFVRLTTDRQSKSGFMWNSNPVGGQEFTTVLQFRISGQGARFFGDGIGMWLTSDSSYQNGMMHGVNEKFTGVGVVIDTFKNTETAAHHKDISIFVNDGTKTKEELTPLAEGCDAALRYHEKRADFSVTNSSRIKLQYGAGTLRVKVDAKSNGEWVDCTTVNVLEKGLPEDWATGSYLGLTATTGQLADNHDVLGLSSYSQADDQYADYEDEHYRHANRPLEEQHGGDQVLMLQAKIDTLRSELEHQLSAVNEGLKHSLQKLQKQEEAAEQRIVILEERISSKIVDHVSAHVEAVKGDLHSDISDSFSQQIDSVSNSIGSTVNEHLTKSASLSGGWKMPFLILVVLVMAVGGMGYSKYRDFKKTHLL
jgi:lectin, mannose-binding 2